MSDVYYTAAAETFGPYASPAAAVDAARLAGHLAFSVVRAEGPAGFYSAFRSYADGRPSPAPVAARRGRGNGYGYRSTPRRSR